MGRDSDANRAPEQLPRHRWSHGIKTEMDPQFANARVKAEVGLDVRFPTRRTLGGRRLDWSVYGIRRRFLNKLSFDQLDGTEITLSDQNELGFTLGLDRPWSLWLLHIDRIGLGFRFGDRLNSVRILFGVPF